MTGVAAEDPGWTARKLLRAARVATLATQSGGWPFAALVTPATDAELTLLLLLSDLSEHTRHLRREPRCAVMVAGEADGPNPQTTPRVTVSGRADIVADPAALQRYLAVHPYAAGYAGFSDFNIWRVTPDDGQLVAGFGRAHRLRREHLRPPAGAVEAIAPAAPRIMQHCNTDHAGTLALLADRPGAWRMVGVDAEGCDLAGPEDARVLRLAWPAPVADADGVRQALIHLARAARGG